MGRRLQPVSAVQYSDYLNSLSEEPTVQYDTFEEPHHSTSYSLLFSIVLLYTAIKIDTYISVYPLCHTDYTFSTQMSREYCSAKL